MRIVYLACALGAYALGGCAPSCEALCTKLVRCDLEPSVTVVECTQTCDRQLAFVKDQNDDALSDAWRDQRVCLGANSCDEIAAGACFDDALFLIDGS
jgi:hypothetical protein